MLQGPWLRGFRDLTCAAVWNQLFLGKALDPPPVAAMEKAWSVLQELGAVDENDKLTALGRHLVRC